MNALISLACGIAAWLIPCFELMSRKTRPYAAALSLGLCTFAIFLQLLEYESRIMAHDWSALLDICHAESIVCGILLAVALALNLLAWFLLGREEKTSASHHINEGG